MKALIIFLVLFAFIVGAWLLNRNKVKGDSNGSGGYVDTDTKGNQEV